MQWTSGYDAQVHEQNFDLIILGTGYRNKAPRLLNPVAAQLGIDGFDVSRDYRARIDCARGVSMHLLGVNEATHGISDTLLSVVGSRAERVLRDIENETQIPASAALSNLKMLQPLEAALAA
jgi:L-ornithine N5-oxygenase